MLFEIHQGLREAIQDWMTGHAVKSVKQLVKLATSIEVTMKRKVAARKANDLKAKSREKKPEAKVEDKRSQPKAVESQHRSLVQAGSVPHQRHSSQNVIFAASLDTWQMVVPAH